MKRLLIAASIAVLTLAMSVPAMADRDRHHGASSHHYAHDRHLDRATHHGKHHRKVHYKRHHRTHRRVVEQHYYDRGYDRRSRYRDDRRHSSDIPLVTVDGYPVVRIQVNH